jgi:hypothetical protein
MYSSNSPCMYYCAIKIDSYMETVVLWIYVQLCSIVHNWALPSGKISPPMLTLSWKFGSASKKNTGKKNQLIINVLRIYIML